MTRALTAIAVAAIVAPGCTSAPRNDLPAAPMTECVGADLPQFQGRSFTEELRDELLRVSAAKFIRTVRPGEMVTMDFNPQRLTVHLDSTNRIERLACG